MSKAITISTLAISDHMSRLYDEWESDGTTYHHVDGPDSGTITIVKRGPKTTQVTMTMSAVREFIDDMKYQVEIYEDSFERAYNAQCKRALVSIRKQVQ
jgi:hypothetical protein